MLRSRRRLRLEALEPRNRKSPAEGITPGSIWWGVAPDEGGV